MRIFAVILIFAFVFGFIFVQSGAWEVDTKTLEQDGVEVARRKHRIHWDKFFGYIKRIPGRIKRMVGGEHAAPAPSK